MEHRLSAAAIEEASRIVDPTFLDSPQWEAETLAAALGCALTLKDETQNPIRNFKGRGADYFVSKVMARGDGRLMVCASTGNFGQAMAYACRKNRLGLVVYADRNANEVKKARISELGAEVRLEGDDFDEAKAAAKNFCLETGAWMVEDGLEPEISEGAGTISVELLRDGPFSAVLIPLGNGALLNGNARWIKEAAPATEVIGVCASGADAMEKSWRNRSIVDGVTVETISEGIAVRVPVPAAVEDMYGLVDDVLLVDDEVTIEAMRVIHAHTGLAVEPAAAVGIGAILDHPQRFADRRVATIITGANLTKQQRSRWLG